MFKLGDISFGGKVRILASDSTTASGHADLIGVCHGITTPSVTCLEVVGYAPDDIALNVHFDDPTVRDAWFAPEHVGIVDHGVGSQATVGDHRFVKTRADDWVPDPPGSGDASA